MPAEPASASDSIARLRLARTRGIGPVTFRQLLQRFGDAASALAAIPDLARRGGGTPPGIATVDAAEREIDAVARMGGRHLFVGQGLYPSILAQIDTAPPVLIARGKLALLDPPALAMVGARNASAA
ncbi:MAG: DNA-processing protein DprA, partial [Sphingomonadaceae bacterium]|nr:DNA-processing protein DprA [Sphingomonadaceae bacterium]